MAAHHGGAPLPPVGATFADQHSSLQWGLNESHNGLLPKSCDFSKANDKQVLDAVWQLNHRK